MRKISVILLSLFVILLFSCACNRSSSNRSSRNLRQPPPYFSEGRAEDQGLFVNLPVISNMTISHLGALSRFNFFIRSSHEKKIINEYIKLLNIKLKEPGQPINALSGGNQQKVIIARNLMIDPGIIILDEPTRGIDVGAKEEIYQLISGLAEKGMGIIFISSELQEIMSVSDRIAVLHEGRLAGILKREEVTEKKLIAFATGYKLQFAV